MSPSLSIQHRAHPMWSSTQREGSGFEEPEMFPNPNSQSQQPTKWQVAQYVWRGGFSEFKIDEKNLHSTWCDYIYCINSCNITLWTIAIVFLNSGFVKKRKQQNQPNSRHPQHSSADGWLNTCRQCCTLFSLFLPVFTLLTSCDQKQCWG